MTETVTLPDGRLLAYEEYGDRAGRPVLSFHGGLSSRLDAAPAHEAARSLGIRLISPDRPGMGWSTYQPGRRLLDWPEDVTALTAHLGIGRFAVMGWSCGGPYAAVCAAKMPGRVTTVALLSSAIPFELVGSTRGLPRSDRLLLWLVRRAPSLAALALRVSIADATEKRLYREVTHSVAHVDRAALLERGSRDDAVAFIKESMRQGTAGCIQDYRVFGAPWGFDLAEVLVPVHIWEGSMDRTGPAAYRELLAAHLPDTRLSLVPGEGHISLLQHEAATILAALIAG